MWNTDAMIEVELIQYKSGVLARLARRAEDRVTDQLDLVAGAGEIRPVPGFDRDNARDGGCHRNGGDHRGDGGQKADEGGDVHFLQISC